jgi:hypothetical protein
MVHDDRPHIWVDVFVYIDADQTEIEHTETHDRVDDVEFPGLERTLGAEENETEEGLRPQ